MTGLREGNKEMKSLSNSRVIAGFVVAIIGFLFLYHFFRPADLIILLNSVFAGSLVAIAVAYKDLLWAAIRGEGAYDRTRQFTISVFLQWVVIAIGVSTSIYVRAADLPTTAYVAIAFARYVATIAAILQVMAPDMGYDFFYGRDRKSLTLSVTIGIIVAVVTILIQKA